MEDEYIYFVKGLKRKLEICILSRILELWKKWFVGCYRYVGVVVDRILEFSCCLVRMVRLSQDMECEFYVIFQRSI